MLNIDTQEIVYKNFGDNSTLFEKMRKEKWNKNYSNETWNDEIASLSPELRPLNSASGAKAKPAWLTD